MSKLTLLNIPPPVVLNRFLALELVFIFCANSIGDVDIERNMGNAKRRESSWVVGDHWERNRADIVQEIRHCPGVSIIGVVYALLGNQMVSGVVPWWSKDNNVQISV
jgi:hypothetical protein